MFKTKSTAIVFMEIVLFVWLAGLCSTPSAAVAQAHSAQRGWHEEFEDVCSKTQDAMNLSVEELTVLVQRCDALLPQLENLDETRKKVFIGRLQRCRGLYVYVLDSKKNEK